MKIDVDWSRCEGHGLCTEQAPGLFALDDDGDLLYSYQDADIPGELAPSARSAIGACPVAALREHE
nr:ferredoxin [Rhodococcus sp. (in: high G+C Gram-positive bacteria)]